MLLLATASAFASFEGEVAAYSNYIWRGTTFTENKPAIQADLASEGKSGLFVGTFISNAEFSDEALGNNAQVTSEFDFLAGQHWDGDNWDIQLTYNRYMFPGAGVFDADDFSVLGNYKNYFIELSYMDDYFGYQSIYKYVRLGYGCSIREGIETTLYAGYNAFSNPKGQLITHSNGSETTSGAGNPDYIDVYFLNRKTLDNGMILELGINWTNRKEYLADAGEITLDEAKDFTGVVGLIVPLTL